MCDQRSLQMSLQEFPRNNPHFGITFDWKLIKTDTTLVLTRLLAHEHKDQEEQLQNNYEIESDKFLVFKGERYCLKIITFANLGLNVTSRAYQRMILEYL